MGKLIGVSPRALTATSVVLAALFSTLALGADPGEATYQAIRLRNRRVVACVADHRHKRAAESA